MLNDETWNGAVVDKNFIFLYWFVEKLWREWYLDNLGVLMFSGGVKVEDCGEMD